jgi:hypothetical protein
MDLRKWLLLSALVLPVGALAGHLTASFPVTVTVVAACDESILIPVQPERFAPGRRTHLDDRYTVVKVCSECQWSIVRSKGTVTLYF